MLTDQEIADIIGFPNEGPVARTYYSICRAVEARVLAAAQAKSGPAVAGWQLVPVDPTPTMMNIARGQLAKRNLWGVWKAMLAAAPSAEGGS